MFIFVFILYRFNLFEKWVLKPRVLIQLYFGIAADMLFAWLLELNHQMFQNEAEGFYNAWWGSREVPWWTFSLSTMAFHVLYCVYDNLKHGGIDSLKALGPLENTGAVTFFTIHLICTCGVCLSISAQVFYW